MSVPRKLRSTVLGLAALLASAAPFAAQANDSFNAAQQAQIGKIAADYLVQHPEVLARASQHLQQQREAEATSHLRDTAITQADALLEDRATPSVGPADAKVAVVEFFDYQCVYCSHSAPEVEKVMKSRPDARYLFKEFPVFGSRWPASTEAAENGLTLYREQGAEAYLAYHNGIFASGKNEGALAHSDITALTDQAGLSAAQLDAGRKQADAWLDDTMKLAQTLGIMGTPAFIVMPTQGANVGNVTVIPGATDQATLEQAIDRASQG